ncbi:phBC6A51 family helix-turn-helix protein [Tissierella sp.]|uniref:phBC6A51 family helix-turn-helix protein n=1 Tax=Tissierella sp. TaxID=41274 RepID=UPI00303D84F0
MDSLQNFTNTNLTDKEKNLLEVLINPENRMKSITDICKLAKCSRPVYYEAFAKPEFVETYKQYSVDLVKQSVASVINTFIREAQRGSFPHGKVLLEMAGLYTDKLDLTLEKSEKLSDIMDQIGGEGLDE